MIWKGKPSLFPVSFLCINFLCESAKPGHVRLGYMGHLTLISEDVITALEHYPPELKLLLAQYAPQPDWDEYVGGRYQETKTKDTSLLGGGKPIVTPGDARSASKWRVDEADATAVASANMSSNGANVTLSDPPLLSMSQLKGEFRRTSRLSRESSADFGVAPYAPPDDDEDGDEANHDDNNVGSSQVCFNGLTSRQCTH